VYGSVRSNKFGTDFEVSTAALNAVRTGVRTALIRARISR